MEGHDVEAREEPPGEIADRHLERLVTDPAAEVMRLVDDEQVEPVAEPVHVPVGALERRDGHRRELAHAVAVAADRPAVGLLQLAPPLVEEHPGGHEAEAGEPRPRHRGHRHAGLAAAGGQDDQAAPAGEFPGAERRLLVGSQRGRRPRVRPPVGRPDGVRELDPETQQQSPEAGVAAGRRAVGPHARIPQDVRDFREVELGGRIEEQDRPPVEDETHGRSGSSMRARPGSCMSAAPRGFVAVLAIALSKL